MSDIQIELPEELQDALRDAAARQGASVSSLVTQAIIEKLSALKTEDYLSTRAKRSSREKFLAALAKIPDVEPEEYDRIE